MPFHLEVQGFKQVAKHSLFAKGGRCLQIAKERNWIVSDRKLVRFDEAYLAITPLINIYFN